MTCSIWGNEELRQGWQTARLGILAESLVFFLYFLSCLSYDQIETDAVGKVPLARSLGFWRKAPRWTVNTRRLALWHSRSLGVVPTQLVSINTMSSVAMQCFEISAHNNPLGHSCTIIAYSQHARVYPDCRHTKVWQSFWHYQPLLSLKIIALAGYFHCLLYCIVNICVSCKIDDLTK